MAFCPNACGRLAAAASFISIGIVQVIAGIILLKSDYAAMLSGPDFWTAATNLAVGSILGVSATTWKSIDKTSKKCDIRRNFLAALVSSAVILNCTTAGILIIDKGNKLLSFYVLQDSDKSEILAYAYSTSVCCPIVCIVIAIAFLTGICFRRQSDEVETLGVKPLEKRDDGLRYDWVYPRPDPNLPRPDPDVLLHAAKSSESSSRTTTSDSSSDLPTPINLRSLNECNQTQVYSSKNMSLQHSIDRNKMVDDFVSPLSTRAVRVSFAEESSKRTPGRAVRVGEHHLNSTVGSGNRSSPSVMLPKSRQLCSLDNESVHLPDNVLDLAVVYSPRFQSEPDATVLSPNLSRTAINHLKRNTFNRLQVLKNRSYIEGHPALEDSEELDGETSGFQSTKHFQYPHSNVRTSPVGEKETSFVEETEFCGTAHEASGFHPKRLFHPNTIKTSSIDQKATSFDESSELGGSYHEVSSFHSKRPPRYLHPSASRTFGDQKETTFDESLDASSLQLKRQSRSLHQNVSRTSSDDQKAMTFDESLEPGVSCQEVSSFQPKRPALYLYPNTSRTSSCQKETNCYGSSEYGGSRQDASCLQSKRHSRSLHSSVGRASSGDQKVTTLDETEYNISGLEILGFQSKHHRYNVSRTSSGDQKAIAFGELSEYDSSCLEASGFQPKNYQRSVSRTSGDHKETIDESIEFGGPCHQASGSQPNATKHSLNPHLKVFRTSTADNSKIPQELENLDNSVIPFDSEISDANFHDETLLELKHNLLSSPSLGNYSIEDWVKNSPSDIDLSALVRNTNFRKKLASKLTPAATPVVSDGQRFCRTQSTTSLRRDRLEPHSEPSSNYDKYLQTGFSTFKTGRKKDKVDTTKQSNSVVQSPIASISEKSQEEDSFLRSTSNHTSGYMSASNLESEDEPDLVSHQTRVVPSRRHPSFAHKLIADEIRERYRKKSETLSKSTTANQSLSESVERRKIN